MRALANALGSQRLHHAYLFTGTRGVGKTTLARILAKAFNCEQGVSATPCGQCGACAGIDAGRFVDLLEVDAASNTQVDKMRELLENALYAPTAGRYKVYVIDEVHQLSGHSFNAMLKTLEEPPEHVKFVLATTDPQKVPVTVLSRCLQFNLRQIPPAQIRTRLTAILDSEGIAYEAPAISALSEAARGSLRDALSLLDQAIAHGGGSVSAQSVAAMLGLVGREHLHRIADALARRDGAALIGEADAMAAHGLAFEQALHELASLWHRIALAQIIPSAVAADDTDAQQIERLARCFQPDEVQLYYQITNQGRADIVLAPDDYAGFTMALLRMLAFAPESAAGGSADDGAGSASDAPGLTSGVVRRAVGRLAAAVGETAADNAVARSTPGESPSHSIPLPQGDGECVTLSTTVSAQGNGGGLKRSSPPGRDAAMRASRLAPGNLAPLPSPPAPAQEPICPSGRTKLPPPTGGGVGGEGENAPITAAADAGQSPLTDWLRVLEAMKLSGMARQLAQNCELVEDSNGVLGLRLAEAHKHLLEKGPQERLRCALEQHLGRAVRLQIAVGQPVGMTPAQMQTQEQRSKLASAARSLEADPFVRDLVENLGARVVPDSIKPQR